MNQSKFVWLLALPLSGWAQGDTLLLQTVEIIQSAKLSTPALHNRPLLSMDQALSEISGAEILSRGTLGGDLWSRGLGEQRLEVRMDGLPVHGACTDRMDPATIYAEPSQLSQIELNQGSTSFAGGLGQSLNLVPLQADLSDSGERWSSQSVTLGYRWPEWGRNLQATQQYHGSDLAWVLNLNYKGAENLKQAGSLTLPYSSFDKGGASLSTQILTWDHWIWENRIQYDREGYVGYAALPMDVGKAQALLISSGLQKEDFRLRIFHNQVEHAMDDTHRDSVPMHMDMPGWSKVQGLKSEGLWSTQTWDIPWEYEYQDLWKKATMTMYMPGESQMVLETWPSASQHIHHLSLGAQRCLDSASLHHLSIHTQFSWAQSHILSQLGQSEWNIFNAPIRTYDFGSHLGVQIQSHWNSQISTLVDLAWIRRIRSLEERWGYYLYKAGENRDRLGNPWIGSESNWQIQNEINYQGPLQIKWSPWFRYFPKAPYLKPMDSIPSMSPGAAGVLQEQLGQDQMHWGQELELGQAFGKLKAKANLQYLWLRDGQGKIPLYYTPLQGKFSLEYQSSMLNFWTHFAWAPNSSHRADLGERIHQSWNRTDLGLVLPSRYGDFSLEINNLWDQWILRPMDWGIAQSGRSLQLSWTWK